MRAEISIIIPTLNAAADLPACLEALMEGVAGGLIRDLIISDGGSGDLTPEIADAAGAVFVSGAASRGGQLRRGCAAAQGQWLLILHADSRLEAGWADSVAEHLDQGGGQPACFRLGFRARGLMPALIAGWANLRTSWIGLPFGDQGLLVTRKAYDTAGGYPDQPLMEDVALVRALPPVRMLQIQALTGADRYTEGGWFRRGARNLWTQLRYFCGVSPDRLTRTYHRK